MTCVHCARIIPPGRLFVYPHSLASACIECVAVPSIEETDLLLTRQQDRRNTRRVYSTGVRA